MQGRISAEFEFIQFLIDIMRFLIEKEAEAWIVGDEGSAGNFLKIQKRFYSEHLLHWVPGFCDKIQEMVGHFFIAIWLSTQRRLSSTITIPLKALPWPFSGYLP